MIKEYGMYSERFVEYFIEIKCVLSVKYEYI